jgi:uncharacterized protein (TIGR03083 family)
LNPPQPVIVAYLFPALLVELVNLLSGLTPEEWDRPTACGDWTVKDVALHLLGIEVGNLSLRRDGFDTGGHVADWDALVSFLNDFNQSWVRAARRISPRLLIDLMQFVGGQMIAHFQSLDPLETGGPVSWVGPEPAPVWLDLAREYTERWHHQQHIRDAVGKPGLKEPQFMAPALAAFVRAMPRAFAARQAPEGTAVTLAISGPSGGQWTLHREAAAWALYEGAPEQVDALVAVDEDAAWRMFTRGLSREEAQARAAVSGDTALGRAIFDMVSIIA